MHHSNYARYATTLALALALAPDLASVHHHGSDHDPTHHHGSDHDPAQDLAPDHVPAYHHGSDHDPAHDPAHAHGYGGLIVVS